MEKDKTQGESRNKRELVVHYRAGEGREVEDVLAGEEPLQITVDGHPVAVVMRTPGVDEELVRGFLKTEGLVRELSEVARIDTDFKDNHALVFLADGVVFDAARLSRNLFSASSCGICGTASIEALQKDYPPVEGSLVVSAEALLTLPDQMREAQRAFEATGGIHAAALISAEGRCLVVREDVGRHNAIDKVIGWALCQDLAFEDLILQVSGRVSFEVMQKALAVGLSFISAISAPSSLAVQFARVNNQTLVGFLRPPNFNVYSCPERILEK